MAKPREYKIKGMPVTLAEAGEALGTLHKIAPEMLAFLHSDDKEITVRFSKAIDALITLRERSGRTRRVVRAKRK